MRRRGAGAFAVMESRPPGNYIKLNALCRRMEYIMAAIETFKPYVMILSGSAWFLALGSAEWERHVASKNHWECLDSRWHSSVLWSRRAKVAQLCLTLCNLMDCSPLSMGILQARILEWIAIPFSRGSSQLRDWTQVSHIAGGFFTSWATIVVAIEQI